MLLWAGAACLFIIVLLIIILLSNVNMSIDYYYCNNSFDWDITVHCWGIMLWRNTGSKQTDEWEYVLQKLIDQLLNKDDLEQIFPAIKKTKQLIKIILPRIKIRDFYWETKMGTGDAASTGILTGGIWSIKGALGSFLKENCHFLEQPVIQVDPCFNEQQFESQFHCIAFMQLGKAMRIRKKYKQIIMQNQT
ncbi:DUF2953 domain-containing protein [Virgibacillus sp. 179-BFC.A HS]|uniref:DUF2953 domain-containing protein n=1 Tax=Tigheibacillus jepli TaxID=3035914 RepID=A0ABU5CG83_9BACI|nr:DUF2953 domain-containing protein [Virgibacillus sp. 179-BFC.A HS]MDY0405328.1 DUF2953 domain-containing protein [Virgibacillus sp. 179-BFC.A HS]